MKKIIAAILVLTLSFTMFAACKKDENPDAASTTAAFGGEKLPEMALNKGVKEFKNADGKVVYKVEYSVPKLTTENCSAFSAENINGLITEAYLDVAFTFAQNNVQNVRAEETEPRIITISHEIKYRSDNLLSVIFKTAYSKSGTPVIQARTFNLAEGTVLNVEELYLKSISQTKAKLLDHIKKEAKYSLTEDALTDEQLAKFETAFDPINFYITDTSLVFMFDKSSVVAGLGANAGIYEIALNWSSVSAFDLISNPEELFLKEESTQTTQVTA